MKLPTNHPDARPWHPPMLIGRDSKEGTYMIRWVIAQVFGWTLRFHVFLRPDPDCLHDHPWDFWTLVLAGRYTEEYEDTEGKRVQIERTAISLGFRKAEHRHRVIVTHGPCLTLCLTKPRKRQWGFWHGQTFLEWFNFKSAVHRCDTETDNSTPPTQTR